MAAARSDPRRFFFPPAAAQTPRIISPEAARIAHQPGNNFPNAANSAQSF